MRQLFMIFTFVILINGCNNNEVKTNENSFDITLDSLNTYKLTLSKSYKTIAGQGITVMDSISKLNATIDQYPDYVDEKKGLKFVQTYTEFIKDCAKNQCSIDETVSTKVTYEIENYKEFKNKNGIQIYAMEIMVKIQNDSILTKSKCGPLYFIEIPNIIIKKGFVDRTLLCKGDSLVVASVLDKFEFRK